jgi:hypothetical protein
MSLHVWRDFWAESMRFAGRDVPDVEQRIARLLALWRMPIAPGWQRGPDAQLAGDRYRRSDFDTPSREHVIEKAVLCEPFDGFAATRAVSSTA